MESPTGIIPEHLMYPEKKQLVMQFLIAQPLPGDLKRKLFEGWAVTVGTHVPTQDYNTVELSGFEGVTNARNY